MTTMLRKGAIRHYRVYCAINDDGEIKKLEFKDKSNEDPLSLASIEKDGKISFTFNFAYEEWPKETNEATVHQVLFWGDVILHTKKMDGTRGSGMKLVCSAAGEKGEKTKIEFSLIEKTDNFESYEN